jgi:hypothetical protein
MSNILAQLRDELLDGQDPFGGERYAGDPKFRDENYPHTFLPRELAATILRVVRPSFWLEIGSMVGGSAIRTATVAETEGFGTEIVCIDPFCADVGAWVRHTRRGKDEWDCLKLDGGLPTIRERFLENVRAAGFRDRILPFPVTSTVGIEILRTLLTEDRLSEPPSVVYLDAAHDEEETYLEIVRAFKLLPPGGILFGDDFDWPGVEHAVRKFGAWQLVYKQILPPKLVKDAFVPHGVACQQASGEGNVVLYKNHWIFRKRTA